MPLLPLEPFVFPESLFDVVEPVTEQPNRWWVLQSRPRAEKVLARQLLAEHLSFFLPLHKRTWRCRGRRLTSFLPLFPGYVFLLGDDYARLEAFRTRLVASCLPVVDQERLYEDLVRVHQLITSDAPITPEDRLRPGMQVEIVVGPLKGLVGTVIRRGSNLRLVVHVDFIQRGASVEIESWMIQAIGTEKLVAC